MKKSLSWMIIFFSLLIILPIKSICGNADWILPIQENILIGKKDYSLLLGSKVYFRLDEEVMSHLNKIHNLIKRLEELEKNKKKGDTPVSLEQFSAFCEFLNILEDLSKQKDEFFNADINLLALKLRTNKLAIWLDQQNFIFSKFKLDMENINIVGRRGIKYPKDGTATINFLSLIEKYNISTSTSPGLETEAEKLAELINTLKEKLEKEGIKITGTVTLNSNQIPVTTKDIANALINAALSPTNILEKELGFDRLNQQQIRDYIDSAYKAKDVVNRLLGRGGGSIDNNESVAELVGLGLLRLCMYYKDEIIKTKKSKLKYLLGVKLMYGKSLYVDARLKKEEDLKKMEEKIKSSEHTASSFCIGADMGLGYVREFSKLGFLRLKKPGKFFVSLLARDLSKSSFKSPKMAPDEVSFRLPTKLSLEMVFAPINLLQTEVYLDIISYKYFLKTTKYQYFNLMQIFRLINTKNIGLELLVGLIKNLEDAGELLLVPAVNLRLFFLQAKASLGTSKPRECFGIKLPSQASASVYIGFRF